MSKAKEYYKQKTPTKSFKAHKKYTTATSKRLQKKRSNKKQRPPQYEPSQSSNLLHIGDQKLNLD